MLVYFYEIVSNTHHHFSMPRVRRPPAHLDLREQRLPRVAARRGLRDWQAGHVGARLRHERGAEGDRSRLRRPRAHRPPGPQLGRLPVVVHRHADRHVRRRRHGRAADEPHELLRRAVQVESGTVQQGIMEVGQVRMGRDVDAVERGRAVRETSRRSTTSPNITTPFMILHGTADGAVDWHQGLEFFNAAPPERQGGHPAVVSRTSRTTWPKRRTRRTSRCACGSSSITT